MRPRALPLAMAIGLHLLVAVMLVWRAVPARAPSAAQQDSSDRVLLIRFFSAGEKLQRGPGAGAAMADDPCGGEFYVGIGIVAGASGMVVLVAPRAPADRAGIRTGETVVNESILGANRYPDGTPLELVVEDTRGARRIVHLKVERICSA